MVEAGGHIRMGHRNMDDKFYRAVVRMGMPIRWQVLRRKWKTASLADEYAKRVAARCNRYGQG